MRRQRALRAAPVAKARGKARPMTSDAER